MSLMVESASTELRPLARVIFAMPAASAAVSDVMASKSKLCKLARFIVGHPRPAR